MHSATTAACAFNVDRDLFVPQFVANAREIDPHDSVVGLLSKTVKSGHDPVYVSPFPAGFLQHMGNHRFVRRQIAPYALPDDTVLIQAYRHVH